MTGFRDAADPPAPGVPVDPRALTDRGFLARRAYRDEGDLKARQALYTWLHPQHDPPGVVVRCVREHLDRVGVTSSPTCLDIGAGNGLYTRRLRAEMPQVRVVAADISAGILRKVPRPVLLADAAHLPVADRCLDLVLAMHMLYHLPEPAAGIREFARVLTPRGMVLVSTNHSEDKVELDRLWHVAAADVLGGGEVPARVSLSSLFPLETSADHLARSFAQVETMELCGVIRVPTPEPVVAHLASYRAWAERTGVPFEATLDRTAAILSAHIERHGSFTVTSRAGIVVATEPRSSRPPGVPSLSR